MFEKEKRMIRDMTRNEQSETLLKEIPPRAGVFNLHHLHRPYIGGSASPLNRVSPQSDHSSSSSFSNGFCSSSEDGSPFQNPPKHHLPNTHFADGLRLDPGSSHYVRNESDKLMDDLGLCENLMRMRVRDHEQNNHQMKAEGLGFWFGGSSSSSGGSLTLPHNAGPCEGSNRAAFGNPGVEPSSAFGVSRCLNNDVRYPARLQGGGYDSLGFLNRPTDYSSNSRWSDDQRMDPLLQAKTWDSRYVLSHNNFCNSRPMLDDAFVRSQQWGMDPKGGTEVIDPLTYSRLLNSKLGVSSENLLPLHSFPSENTNVVPNIWVPQSHVYMKDAEDLQHFRCEDSLIIQGKGVKHGINKGSNLPRSQKKSSHKELMLKNLKGKGFKLENCTSHRQAGENGGGLINSHAVKYLPVSYSLAKFQGRIYYMAKDQDDSRFLQTMFDEGTDLDIQIVFNEIIDHVGELMMDPFGNYLMQKLLEVCSEEQRMQIVLRVTEEAGQLVRISLNTFGTRVVQKLIERLRSRQEISLVKAALKPGLLDLIKDLNGNHVLQRCLQCLSIEDNKFIFYAAAKFCVDIATHRHGCCVLQRCIDHSTGQYREKLITQISVNGLLLAQDQFGNYVVQYVIELKDPSAIGNLLSQFKGHYVQLSAQKFSSHVVEKCLKHLIESRSQIVTELLSVPHFEQFLQDPFANYVIQSTLAVTKGPLHANLVEALRPHSILRTSPYCKRIFSRNLLKK